MSASSGFGRRTISGWKPKLTSSHGVSGSEECADCVGASRHSLFRPPSGVVRHATTKQGGKHACLAKGRPPMHQRATPSTACDCADDHCSEPQSPLSSTRCRPERSACDAGAAERDDCTLVLATRRSLVHAKEALSREVQHAYAAQCCPTTRLLWQDRPHQLGIHYGSSARYCAAPARRSPDGQDLIGCGEAGRWCIHADCAPSATHFHAYAERAPPAASVGA